jgi:lysyl-tRNA synthetase, class II
MKPEASSQKLKVESQKSEYLELGVPEEWVEPLKALGYDTVDKIKALEKPGKLHQEMMGYRKKNKLEISTVTMEKVNEWIS